MDEGALRRVFECAKAYRESYLLKDKAQDDINRARMLLFLALDALDGGNGARTRAEPRRSVEEGAGAVPAADVAPSGPIA